MARTMADALKTWTDADRARYIAAEKARLEEAWRALMPVAGRLVDIIAGAASGVNIVISGVSREHDRAIIAAVRLAYDTLTYYRMADLQDKLKEAGAVTRYLDL